MWFTAQTQTPAIFCVCVYVCMYDMRVCVCVWYVKVLCFYVLYLAFKIGIMNASNKLEISPFKEYQVLL